MSEVDGERKRRVFRWPQEARELVKAYKERFRIVPPRGGAARKLLVRKVVEVSGNPHGACLRFLRQQLGVSRKRSYREWTKAEQQRLLDLVSSMLVVEAAKVLCRPVASVRAMLHRLEGGGRRGREWFTKYSLATALHIRPAEVQKWMDRGWLKCRVIETSGLKMQTINPDDFCEFFKQFGGQVVGRRLSYEALRFVRDYVFPPSHADLLSVRESYKKRATHASQLGVGTAARLGTASREEEEEDASEQSAEGSSEVA
jgi:hypothetical protein